MDIQGSRGWVWPAGLHIQVSPISLPCDISTDLTPRPQQEELGARLPLRRYLQISGQRLKLGVRQGSPFQVCEHGAVHAQRPRGGLASLGRSATRAGPVAAGPRSRPAAAEARPVVYMATPRRGGGRTASPHGRKWPSPVWAQSGPCRSEPASERLPRWFRSTGH